MSDRPVVLVVEDDPEMNELQRELLDVHGLDSVAAYSGREALEAHDREPADAVLLDLMLPEIDGFETCRRLRTRNTRPLPIVVITALDSDDCRRRSFEAGADAFFTKPFDPDEVVRTIHMLLETKGE
jgi:DNA-binding response OmpR family regulator